MIVHVLFSDVLPLKEVEKAWISSKVELTLSTWINVGQKKI